MRQALLLVLVLLSPGCTVFQQPLSDPDSAVPDADLLGTWQFMDKNDPPSRGNSRARWKNEDSSNTSMYP